MTFRIMLEYDEEARAFSAVCPELPGCASAGDTEDETRRNIREAIELYLKPSEIEIPLLGDYLREGHFFRRLAQVIASVLGSKVSVGQDHALPPAFQPGLQLR
jgi:predicted RNase H-like HicB family nuclease